MTTNRGPQPIGSDAIKWRLFVFGIIGPLIAVSVGVDGGDIFQILAVETLELDPRAVGTALLLGALSIPVQVMAARIPLARARHNIRLFLGIQGALALTTALLILAAPPGSWIAGLVLVVAVLAEIAVSVLYATAWQPIISYTLTVEQRHFINGRARALTGIALLGSAVLFGQLGTTGRALFVAVLGVAALAVGWSLYVLPPPPDDGDSVPDGDSQPHRDSVAAEVSVADDNQQSEAAAAAEINGGGSLINVFIALPAVAFASWPLLVSYAAVTLWPTGNLGFIAGAMALGSVVASGLWRDPGDRLVPLLRIGAGMVGVCSILLVLIDTPVESNVAVGWLLGVVVVGAAARTVLRIAVMELAHRRITNKNAVRVMTLLDVVGSTSFQVGAFFVGFLIAASADGRSVGPVDPYQLWLLITAVGLVLAAARFRSRQASPAA